MKKRRFLASFLSVAMFLSQTHCFGRGVVNDCKALLNTFGQCLKENKKTVIGIGGGALLTGGVAATAVIGYEKYKTSAKHVMRLAVEHENSSNGKERFANASLVPDAVFSHIKTDSTNVAACYYGKNAFSNCIADMKSGGEEKSYAHSDDLIWRNSNTKKYEIGRRSLSGDELENLKYFIEINGAMYGAVYCGAYTNYINDFSNTINYDIINLDYCSRQRGTIFVGDNGKVTYVSGRDYAMKYDYLKSRWRPVLQQ